MSGVLSNGYILWLLLLLPLPPTAQSWSLPIPTSQRKTASSRWSCWYLQGSAGTRSFTQIPTASKTVCSNCSNSNSSSDHVTSLIESFLHRFQSYVELGCLESVTIRGLSKKIIKSIPENTPNRNESHRGSLRMLIGRPIQLDDKKMNQTKEVLHATFKYHTATDIVKNWAMEDACTNLASILYGRKESECIIPASEWQLNLANTKIAFPIQTASIQAINGTEWELNLSSKMKAKLVQRHRCTSTTTSSSTSNSSVRMDNQSNNNDLQHQQHDRRKQYAGSPIDRTAPLWQALGITINNRGQFKVGMLSKFKQCQKFVEIVQHLIRTIVPSPQEQQQNTINNNTSLLSSTTLSIVDMGCGRGYLTFALHMALCELYPKVYTRGLDVRPKLVQEISQIAIQLHINDTLKFETGTIETILQKENSKSITVNHTSTDTKNILIALHACDTATDDALWYGIQQQADIMVVAPCCHRQLRSQLDRLKTKTSSTTTSSGDKPNTKENEDHILADILRHGIYRERMVEIVTDTLRAMLLEYAGYQTQVFEFVGGEHTSKNVMITAVKKKKIPNTKQLQQQQSILLTRIQSLASLYGIEEHKLASWMGLTFVNGQLQSNRTLIPTDKPNIITTRSMPPLPK